MQIKASNLRVLVDPGRAAVAGHEVDALQSVVLGGATGRNAVYNGVYNLNQAHTANGFPVFTHTTGATQHLFCGDSGRWYVGPTASMTAGNHTGWIGSTSNSPSPLGLQWQVYDGTKIVLDPAVTLATPTWLTGSPPDDWILRDATVESYNEESHEHKLVFNNLARTSLHLRLDQHQFLATQHTHLLFIYMYMHFCHVAADFMIECHFIMMIRAHQGCGPNRVVRRKRCARFRCGVPYDHKWTWSPRLFLGNCVIQGDQGDA